MNVQAWEYNRAAAESDANAESVTTPVTGSFLVVEQCHAIATGANGGELTLRRSGVPVFSVSIGSGDSVDLLGGTRLRVNAASPLTLDVKAGIAVTMSGLLFQ